MKKDILIMLLKVRYESRHVVCKYTRRQTIKGSYTWDINKHVIRSLIKDIRNEN